MHTSINKHAYVHLQIDTCACTYVYVYKNARGD